MSVLRRMVAMRDAHAGWPDEHLSIELITRQPFPAAFTEDSKYRLGVLHYAYLTVP